MGLNLDTTRSGYGSRARMEMTQVIGSPRTDFWF
jgi:hypothetical protein